MSIIGTFTPTKEGGWSGNIRTLTINVKARFVPNDNQENERAPAFRVFAGQSEIGAAWRERSNGEYHRDYLSVKLDDPSLLKPINAALFEDAEHKAAKMVWSRHRENE